MTSTQSQLVNKEIDDHFSERYGKANFLSIFGIDESNFSKMISGERKMPKYLKIIMDREKEILRLNKVIEVISPNMDTKEIISHLESQERETINDLRIELDKYKSALRMVQNIQKAANMIIEKLEK